MVNISRNNRTPASVSIVRVQWTTFSRNTEIYLYRGGVNELRVVLLCRCQCGNIVILTCLLLGLWILRISEDVVGIHDIVMDDSYLLSVLGNEY